LDKIKRGYKKIIDIWGADHQGHVPRMKAVMDILGYKGEFEVLICQIVTIKGGKISKREGNIISLNWLIDEVGVDAARFFICKIRCNRRWNLTLIWPNSVPVTRLYSMFSTPMRALPAFCAKQKPKR